MEGDEAISMATKQSVTAFTVSAPADVCEEVIARLWELGTSGIEEKPESLLAYFDGGVTAEDLRRSLADLASVSVAPAEIADVDWVARFREGFRAFGVGSFWITPPWDTTSTPSDQRRLVVDPGRAFGTGTHESTALCLEALTRLAARGPLGRVADVGTGSGILAVAAAQLGAGGVAACDNDPESTDSARRHAALNDVSIGVALADGGRAFRTARFDTVIANITGPLLIERAAELSALARSGGHLVLAGLLTEEASHVIAAYAPFGRAEAATRGEWTGLVIERT
jgi:ribosomal protein L11 methyltransferase